MPRQRSAPRPKPAPAARAAPQRQHAPPPAAPAGHHAPPPAMQQRGGGGGLMSGLMGAVAQGAALGTGSAMAHRAIDGLMGPRGGGGGEAAAPAAAAPEAYAAGPSPEERCAQQAKAFAECMSRNSGDMAACQFYFESMQACKRGDAFLS